MWRRNVGGLDRVVRLVLGLILLPTGLLLMGSHGYGSAVAVLGLIGLATGLTGFCPPYVLFGISTSRKAGQGSGAKAEAQAPSQ